MQSFIPSIAAHLDTVIDAIVNTDDPVWPSVIDLRTKTFPRGEHIPKRVYRLIGAPNGSTLYWDQPLILSAYALSNHLGDAKYTEAADAYVQSFLQTCVTDDAMFQWGNHQYYDVFKREVISFHNGYHELRPITPAWEVFWRHDSQLTEAYIKEFTRLHLYDEKTGGFNRHDDAKKSHAFIEAGAVIVESLAWLYQKTNDEKLLQRALSVAGYSYGHRGAKTKLLRNEPDYGRWDSKVATTETGVWSQSLLRAYDYTGEQSFLQMATDVVYAYLEYGFDEDACQFYGQLDVETGAAHIAEKEGYWPRKYANPWSTDQWPAHDYPMALAEACVRLSAETNDPVYSQAVGRMAKALMETRPQNEDDWTYAEHYGRCIHFLCHAAEESDRAELKVLAQQLADEAQLALYQEDMYLGYHKAGVYEAVDGVGYLLLSLLYLETGTEPILNGFGY